MIICFSKSKILASINLKKQSLLHSDGHYLAVEKAVQKEAIIGTCFESNTQFRKQDSLWL